MRRSLALVFGTRRGITLFSRNALGAFGVLSGLLQLTLAVWSNLKIPSHDRWAVLLALLGISFIFGVAKSWPRRKASRDFGLPDITISIEVGDLFDQHSHLVIGFNDVFDTDTTNGVIISESSVQGQFQKRIYGQDIVRLNAELDSALAGKTVETIEVRADKHDGKLDRYSIGTVAVLGSPVKHYFCVAYSKMQNSLVADSNVDFLWQSLSSVWEAVYLRGQQKPISIPIVGSELARINCLDRESLLKMILLSFVARSRQGMVCKELKIIVHPKDYHHINMLEVAAFLRTL